MATEIGTYLPSYQNVTVFHLRDLLMNKKKKIKNVDVKVIHVPHFDGLTLDTMLGFA